MSDLALWVAIQVVLGAGLCYLGFCTGTRIPLPWRKSFQVGGLSCILLVVIEVSVWILGPP